MGPGSSSATGLLYLEWVTWPRNGEQKYPPRERRTLVRISQENNLFVYWARRWHCPDSWWWRNNDVFRKTLTLTPHRSPLPLPYPLSRKRCKGDADGNYWSKKADYLSFYSIWEAYNNRRFEFKQINRLSASTLLRRKGRRHLQISKRWLHFKQMEIAFPPVQSVLISINSTRRGIGWWPASCWTSCCCVVDGWLILFSLFLLLIILFKRVLEQTFLLPTTVLWCLNNVVVRCFGFGIGSCFWFYRQCWVLLLWSDGFRHLLVEKSLFEGSCAQNVWWI